MYMSNINLQFCLPLPLHLCTKTCIWKQQDRCGDKSVMAELRCAVHQLCLPWLNNTQITECCYKITTHTSNWPVYSSWYVVGIVYTTLVHLPDTSFQRSSYFFQYFIFNSWNSLQILLYHTWKHNSIAKLFLFQLLLLLPETTGWCQTLTVCFLLSNLPLIKKDWQTSVHKLKTCLLYVYFAQISVEIVLHCSDGCTWTHKYKQLVFFLISKLIICIWIYWFIYLLLQS